MTTERPAIEPIRSAYEVQFLSDEQLDDMQEATLRLLEDVGVRFPSEKALAVFAEHGAQVDRETEVVRSPMISSPGERERIADLSEVFRAHQGTNVCVTPDSEGGTPREDR